MAEQDKTPEKMCKKCGGLFTGRYCKVCASAYGAKWRASNQGKIIATWAKWHAENSSKVKAKKKQWMIDNAEKMKLYYSNRRKINSEKLKQYRAVQYAANAEKAKKQATEWRMKNKERHMGSVSKWRSNNKEKVKEIVRLGNHKRRGWQRANGALSIGLPSKLYKLQRGKCACGCGQDLGTNYHVDHIMPLALGGANEDFNIQLLRPLCNNQKHAKHPIDFMRSRGFLI